MACRPSLPASRPDLLPLTLLLPPIFCCRSSSTTSSCSVQHPRQARAATSGGCMQRCGRRRFQRGVGRRTTMQALRSLLGAACRMLGYPAQCSVPFLQLMIPWTMSNTSRAPPPTASGPLAQGVARRGAQGGGGAPVCVRRHGAVHHGRARRRAEVGRVASGRRSAMAGGRRAQGRRATGAA